MVNSNSPTPRIVSLATVISSSVARIQDIIDAQGAPSPSFDENAPSLPLEITEAQDAVLDAAAELQDLLTDPLNMIHRSSRSDKSACLQTVARFDIASRVPPNGRVSFAEIASQTPLTEQMVGRIIRHAMTMRIFCEPEPGVVAHTKASRLLASPNMRDWTLAGTEELGPAGGKLAEALERWPGSQEPNETGYSLANDTTKSIFQTIGESPDRAVRFANAMEVMTAKPEFDLSYATDYYNWAALGEIQVVDVGGGGGHFATALARKHDNIRIVVQDMAEVIENTALEGADRDQERISFMAYNLFNSQTVRADVFFFRWIFHNWSDQYCVRILKAQVPALKPGARLLVQEALLPESATVSHWREKDFKAMDLEMAYTFNSRERSLADWVTLFQQADTAFVLRNVISPRGSALGILEFVWKGVNNHAD